MLRTTVYDTGGNNDGYLDPGETADLTATLKNVGGVDFTYLTTAIEGSDPYITITDNAGSFGSLAIDSVKENTDDPYVVSVSASAPIGHRAEFMLIAMDNGFVDTFAFDLVVGSYDYLVWEPDSMPGSGETIDSILTSFGYTGDYCTTLDTAASLGVYKALFVCVGVDPNNYLIESGSCAANMLVDYLNGGGRMYLEGGDVWTVGYHFAPLFGIIQITNGINFFGPVVGVAGTFTEGMYFPYGGENSDMDEIAPTGTGFVIFYDDDNVSDCGVANDAGTHRTVGVSFELSGLVDGAGVSTKAALLDSIMHFFGVFPTGVEEVKKRDFVVPKLALYPNPFRQKTDIRWQIADNSQKISLKIFDIAGRLVKEFNQLTNHQSPINHIIWDAKDNSGRRVSSGIYFVHLEAADDYKVTKKVILIE